MEKDKRLNVNKDIRLQHKVINIGKALGGFCLFILAVSLISFALMYFSPADPIATFMRTRASGMSEAQRAALVQQWGLDKGFLQRWAIWIGRAATGDFGTSQIYNRSVGEVIAQAASSSLPLFFISWFLSGILGVILGIVSGNKGSKLADKLICGLSMIISATPGFWIAILLISIFSIQLGLFPFGLSGPLGVQTWEISIADRIYHMVLPCLCLIIVATPEVALHTRAKVITTLNSDYMFYAQTKGVKSSELIRRCGMKNIIFPALTLQLANVCELISAMVVIESAFSYPGLGRICVSAALGNDVPLLLCATLIVATFVYWANVLARRLTEKLDPRIGDSYE